MPRLKTVPRHGEPGYIGPIGCLSPEICKDEIMVSLPVGWRVLEVLRRAGKRTGTKDKYFINDYGRRFRSLADVRRHLELYGRGNR